MKIDNDVITGGTLKNNQIVGARYEVVLTAALPAASVAMNGAIIIEDAGAGDRNLIIYAGGQRFRIDGGANV